MMNFESFSSQEDSSEDLELVEQLRNPEEVTVGEETLRIFDVSPSVESLPNDVPVVLGPGLLQTGERNRELMFEIAKRGRRALTFSAIHGIEEHRDDIENADEYPESELRKVAALIRAIEEKEVEKIDYVGHSEGTIYGLIAAALYPEKFRNIILSSPIGFHENDTPLKLAARYLQEIVKGAAKDLRPAKREEWVEKIGTGVGYASDVFDSAWSRNEAKRVQSGEKNEASQQQARLSPQKLLEEVRGLSKISIVKLLRKAKENGIPVVISYGPEDKTTSNESVQESLSSDLVEGVYSVRGGHFTPHWAPNKFALLILLPHKESTLFKKEGPR
jgi:pimeloyl-ACP methyl ester carboxylesterase